MAETTSGFKGFLGKETAGLPNWAWLVVIVGGIAAVYIVPKFLGQSGNSTQTASDTGSGTSGLGLAVDPTTGLPYAVEGLVPSGGTVGTFQNPPPPPSPNPTVPAPPTPQQITAITTKAGAALETSPRDANGGHTILNLPLNAILTILSGPVPDPQGTSKVYYLASYNGQTGYVGSDVLKMNGGVTNSSGAGTTITPQEMTPIWPGSGTKQIRLTEAPFARYGGLNGNG